MFPSNKSPNWAKNYSARNSTDLDCPVHQQKHRKQHPLTNINQRKQQNPPGRETTPIQLIKPPKREGGKDKRETDYIY